MAGAAIQFRGVLRMRRQWQPMRGDDGVCPAVREGDDGRCLMSRGGARAGQEKQRWLKRMALSGRPGVCAGGAAARS